MKLKTLLKTNATIEPNLIPIRVGGVDLKWEEANLHCSLTPKLHFVIRPTTTASGNYDQKEIDLKVNYEESLAVACIHVGARIGLFFLYVLHENNFVYAG